LFVNEETKTKTRRKKKTKKKQKTLTSANFTSLLARERAHKSVRVAWLLTGSLATICKE
jgi:hypothetical protein